MRVGRGWVAVVGLLTVACLSSAIPVSPDPEAPLDTRLLGNWHCLTNRPSSVNAPEPAVLRVRSEDAGHFLADLFAPDEEPDQYRLHASIVGGETFLNVQEVKDGVATGDWVFLRYALFREHLLDVATVSENVVGSGHASSPAALRASLESALADPRGTEVLFSCVRVETE